MTFLEIPEYQAMIARPRLSVYEKMERTTFLIQNVTEHLWFCNSALTTASRYWEARVEVFGGDVV